MIQVLREQKHHFFRWLFKGQPQMNAPVRSMVMRKHGMADTGDTPENDLPHQPWVFFVVEDDSDDCMLARRVLERSPYAGEIICLTSGEDLFKTLERMSFFEENGPSCERCVVLLDINLVKDDGLALLDTLRNHPRTSDMPIIMVTGETGSENVETSYRRHANAFIVKPLRPEHLDEIHAVMREGTPRMKVH